MELHHLSLPDTLKLTDPFLPVVIQTMNKLTEQLIDAGYKVFGNKNISDRPIIIVDEKWLKEAEECDREGILGQLINYANSKLNKI